MKLLVTSFCLLLTKRNASAFSPVRVQRQCRGCLSTWKSKPLYVTTMAPEAASTSSTESDLTSDLIEDEFASLEDLFDETTTKIAQIRKNAAHIQQLEEQAALVDPVIMKEVMADQEEAEAMKRLLVEAKATLYAYGVNSPETCQAWEELDAVLRHHHHHYPHGVSAAAARHLTNAAIDMLMLSDGFDGESPSGTFFM